MSCINFYIDDYNVTYTIENVLHYNIGRTTNENQVIVFKNPTYKDWFRIIIMTVFAILQACLTLLPTPAGEVIRICFPFSTR